MKGLVRRRCAYNVVERAKDINIVIIKIKEQFPSVHSFYSSLSRRLYTLFVLKIDNLPEWIKVRYKL